jgi:hypothetical protein
MNRKQCFLEALLHNAKYAKAYYNLGNALDHSEIVQMLDGSELTKIDLYLESLKHDPNNSRVLNSLGCVIGGNQKIKLPGNQM